MCMLVISGGLKAIKMTNLRPQDSLVNNAGLGNVSGSPFIHELEEEDWDRIMFVFSRKLLVKKVHMY